MITPVSAAPEPKARFVPSKWEYKRVMKLARAIQKVCRYLQAPVFLSFPITSSEPVCSSSSHWLNLNQHPSCASSFSQGRIQVGPKPKEEEKFYDLWTGRGEHQHRHLPASMKLPPPKMLLPGE